MGSPIEDGTIKNMMSGSKGGFPGSLRQRIFVSGIKIYAAVVDRYLPRKADWIGSWYEKYFWKEHLSDPFWRKPRQ